MYVSFAFCAVAYLIARSVSMHIWKVLTAAIAQWKPKNISHNPKTNSIVGYLLFSRSEYPH